jgi:hypothetical protein
MGEVWTGNTTEKIHPDQEEPLERIMETCPECNGSGLEKKCDKSKTQQS